DRLWQWVRDQIPLTRSSPASRASKSRLPLPSSMGMRWICISSNSPAFRYCLRMSCGARVVWRRRASSHHPVLEVRDAGRLDGTALLKLPLRVPEIVEDASTVAEQYGNDVELQLVQQSRRQVLLNNLAAAPKDDVLAAGGLLCLFERGLDSLGDEVERCPTLHLHGITRIMRNDEHWVVVGRVVTLPPRPLLVAPRATADRAEHVPAHHPSADVLERFLEDPCALVHLAPLRAVGLAPGGQLQHPVVEPLAALAERVLLGLVRAGDETVQRDRDLTPNFAHITSGAWVCPDWLALQE